MTQVYFSVKNEIQVLEAAFERRLPVLLKGPTGCGKSRFVGAMAEKHGLSLTTIVCNEETNANDLLGRYLILNNETIWRDGIVTKAVREGHLLYLDEVAEAREDVLTLLHSLSDYRRELYLDRTHEKIVAHSRFQLIASFNPGYQSSLKELKPSLRQRFISIPFQYPEAETEMKILQAETSCSAEIAKKWVNLARKIRSIDNLSLRETVSTRLLIYAAHLEASGLPARDAAESAIVQSLTDDAEIAQALHDLVTMMV